MEGIGLSTQVFDVIGARYLRGNELDPAQTQENSQRLRRTSRTALLDGSVSVYDTGSSVGDRNIIVRVKQPTWALVTFFNYLVDNYAEITVTTQESAYSGVPNRAYLADGEAILEILLTERLTD
jgi:hypothetical protein